MIRDHQRIHFLLSQRLKARQPSVAPAHCTCGKLPAGNNRPPRWPAQGVLLFTPTESGAILGKNSTKSGGNEEVGARNGEM